MSDPFDIDHTNFDFKEIRKRFNKSSQRRYEIINAKILHWKRLASIDDLPSEQRAAVAQTWFDQFINLTKYEQRIVRVFRNAIDKTLGDFAELDSHMKDQTSDERVKFADLIRELDFLVMVFQRCDKIVALYEARIEFS